MIRPPAAVGDPSPVWPLEHDERRRITDDVGDCRPTAACRAGGGTRHHAGEDLVAARGTIILAPEAGEVVTVRPSWYEGTGLLLLQGDSGLVINLGEIEPNSEAEFGISKGVRVIKGQPVARVGWHEQLHFETYVKGTRDTSKWLLGSPPPATLLDPVPYLRAAASSGRARPRPAPPTTPPVDPEPVAPTDPNTASSEGGGGALVAILAALAFGAVRRRRAA